MTIAHAGPVGAFVATETRVETLGGSYIDTGGKIVPVGSQGWAVASGGGGACMAALRALRGAGAPPEGVDTLSWVGGLLAGALAAGGHGLEPTPDRDAPGYEDAARVSIVLPVRGRPLLLWADNAAVSPSGVFTTAPWGLEPEERDRLLAEIVDTFRHDATGPGSLEDRIRLAAGFFVRAGHAESISETLEVGYILPTAAGPFAGFIRGPARDIADHRAPGHLLVDFQAACDARLFGERRLSEVGELAVAHLRDDGHAAESFRYHDGVDPRPYIVGKRSHRNLVDGDPITWDVAYQVPPTVILTGGVSSRPDSGAGFNPNQPVSREVYATNLDAGGFDVVARIVQRGSLGSESADYPSGAITATGTGNAKTILNFTSGKPKANDDAYRTAYAVTLTPINFGDTVSITVAVDVDRGDGAGWEERATYSYDATDPPGRSWPEEELAAMVADLGDAADIRVYVKEATGTGSFSVDPVDVSWSTSTDVTDTATPDGYVVHGEVYG